MASPLEAPLAKLVVTVLSGGVVGCFALGHPQAASITGSRHSQPDAFLHLCLFLLVALRYSFIGTIEGLLQVMPMWGLLLEALGFQGLRFRDYKLRDYSGERGFGLGIHRVSDLGYGHLGFRVEALRCRVRGLGVAAFRV